MKNVYTFMAAAVLASAMTVSASTFEKSAVSVSETTMHGKVKADIKPVVGLSTDFMRDTKKVASRAEEGWEEVGQSYMLDALFTGEEVDVTIEKSTDVDGFYRAVGAWAGTGIEGTEPFYWDASDPNVTVVPAQPTGIESKLGDDSGEICIMSFSYYLQQNGYSYEDMVAEGYEANLFKMEDGVLFMPARTMLVFVEGAEDIYWISNAMYVVMPGAEFTPEWESIGFGTYFDGIVSPMYGLAEAQQEEIEVEVQKSNWTEGMYRVIDPYQVLFSYKFGGEPLYLDLTDPDCIFVPYQTTGVEDQEDGETYIVGYAQLLYENGEEDGITVDDIKAQIPEYLISLDEATRKITFPGNSVLFNWPESANPSSCYTARNAYAGYLILPEETGVYNIAVDTNNESMEVYNIQGMRVANPEPGQLYIVKQGNKVTKIIRK